MTDITFDGLLDAPNVSDVLHLLTDPELVESLDEAEEMMAADDTPVCFEFWREVFGAANAEISERTKI